MKAARLTTVRLDHSADIVRLREVALALTSVLKFGAFERTRAVTAVVELGRNAIEHGRKGRASFSLTEVKGRPALGVSVLDQGRGIPPDRLEGDEAVTSANGLGLGLRGVQRIAERFHVETGSEGTKIDVTFRSSVPMISSATLVQEAIDALLQLQATDPAAALTEQNRELMETLADRDLLMKELHHRTGNNLALIVALIRMSKSHSAKGETREVLSELETRVAALAKAHELMQRATTAGTVRAAELLQEVAANAERAFSAPDLRVTISVNAAPMELDGKLAVDIGLIVGELITNAYKHAFKGRTEGTITVTLSTSPQQGLVLEVVDDGTGLAPGADRPERSNSLGWQLIRTLSFQNNATLTVNGESGLAVQINFAPPK
ncbi:sensor histidine kinase [Thioclava atlantica]|uniref:histidine kinase n=1 Tax=Thioclava atlantica TaxID=1317124 RepID=A0A085TRQ7_9RHOB|nr:ATP-binding protein [Thioclava atlantica]KFE33404.1 signal transduction histidine kinase [Thioclava atlantica]